MDLKQYINFLSKRGWKEEARAIERNWTLASKEERQELMADLEEMINKKQMPKIKEI